MALVLGVCVVSSELPLHPTISQGVKAPSSTPCFQSPNLNPSWGLGMRGYTGSFHLSKFLGFFPLRLSRGSPDVLHQPLEPWRRVLLKACSWQPPFLAPLPCPGAPDFHCGEAVGPRAVMALLLSGTTGAWTWNPGERGSQPTATTTTTK